MQYFVHPTAVIDENVSIGISTNIWHFSHIMPDARIGEACNLGQNVFVDVGVSIGDRVKIQNNVSVYKGVVIEDDVFVGPSVVFTNVINPRSFIDRKPEILSTIIKQGATIGANATIVCGVTIGEYAMIGAGSVVTKDVAPYMLMAGNPATCIGKVDKEGNKV
ncbi:MAG: acyltransferase [Chitinophagaceae bacterium]